MSLKRFVKKTIPEPLFHPASEVYRNTRALWYVGWNKECPCCDSSLRKYPKNHRNQDTCPRCYSLPRTRLLWFCIKKHTQWLNTPATLLHFSPRSALRYRLQKYSHLNYITTNIVGVDDDVLTDITRLPFPDNTFDGIINSHVMEHILDDYGAFAELYRVLKPGRKMIVMMPIDWNRSQTYEDDSIVTAEARTVAFGQHDHVRIYGTDYVGRPQSAGFTVDVLTKDDVLSDPTDRYSCSNLDRETLYICSK